MTVIHATCVALDGSGVLLRGSSGSGKSDLAVRLIDAGAMLVADDGCALTVRADRVYATAPRAIAGCIEVRGFGVIALPYLPEAPLRLVADLTPRAEIERMPESSTCRIAGVSVPRLFVDPETASAPAKIRVLLQSIMAVAKARTMSA